MVTFNSPEYEKKVEKLNAHIEERYKDYKIDLFELKGEMSGEVFVKTIMYAAWKEFYYRFATNRSALDRNTVFNRKHLEERALIDLESLNQSEGIFLNIMLRLMGEYHFWSNEPGNSPLYLKTIVLERLDREVSNNFMVGEFSWIERSMPASIARDFIQSSDFSDVIKLKEDIASVEMKVKGVIENETTKLTADLELRKEDVEKLLGKADVSIVNLQSYNDKLDEYKGEFNFVLLSKAFSRMKNDKKQELKNARRWMNFYTLVLMAIPTLTLVTLLNAWINFDSSLKHLIYAVPLLTLEVLIFYFMRLYYGEVRSIRAQLLQIDLRLSLCEFIHDFIGKKNESKENSDSWATFESLIFSPIQMSADNIPSVLDGANAVADVLGKVMPKK